MIEIQYFDTPSPHMVIDNFLLPNQAKEILQECIDLEKNYEPAHTGTNHIADDCEECKKITKHQQTFIRKNDVVFLDNFYRGKRKESKILTYLHERLMDKTINDVFKNKGFFHILKSVNSSESILSRYGMCDFYGFHTDKIDIKNLVRTVTICYYINKEPEEFEGGDLIICGETVNDQKKIKPKHNRAIIFQSDTTLHAVDSVKILKDDFSSGRFSINWWVGFEDQSGFRFR